MVPKSFSRASLGCPVRLRNNTMPAALEEGGVLPWRELSMTWARLDAKITASNNDLRGGSRPALPPADRRGHRFLRERIDVSKKTRGVTPRGAKVCGRGGRYRGQNETELFGGGCIAVLCMVGNGGRRPIAISDENGGAAPTRSRDTEYGFKSGYISGSGAGRDSYWDFDPTCVRGV